MSTEDFKITGRSWAMHLAQIPVERVQDVYHGAVIGSSFPPTVKDFADTWQTITDDEKREWKALEWKRQDEQTIKALPESPDGPGRTAWLELMARMRSGLGGVVCDCGQAAQLAPGGRRWVCQHSKCNFVVNADAIGKLPKVKGSGLVDGLESAAPHVEDELAKLSNSAGNHPRGLSMAADDCNVDLDELSAAQYSDFKSFLNWWKTQERGRLSPELFAEQWLVFAEQRVLKKEVA